ncbi:terminase large subunit [Xanthomonas phage DMF5-T1]|nr:terminase large subunit [Xanthomonas phage DMF5-T1]
MTYHTTACPDWADRLQRGDSIIPPPIFPERAEEALKVFKRLRIVDAPGSPTFGEACGQWVFDLVAAIFGAYDAETGRRLIREALVLIPKKNSKSTLAAGIMVTALVLNWRQSAELLILAPTIKIARNAFDPARDMIYADPQLKKLLKVSESVRTITHLKTQAVLKVLAADSDTVGGNKASWVLVDELWLFGKRAATAAMFREAFGGLASRPEGVVIKLTTQSDEPPDGVFREDLKLYRDIRDGVVVDDKRLPVLYEHPPEMVEDGRALLLENMPLVNPNYGRSVDSEFLSDEFRKAEHTGIGELRGFLAKHANVELGLNLRSDRWAGADFWEAQADPTLTLDSLCARSEVAVVGIDGGGLDDLLGLTVIGRCRVTRRWLSWSHAWAHSIVLERRKDIKQKLEDFAAAGDLTIVEKPGDDVEDVCEIVRRLEDIGLLPAANAVGVDPVGIDAIVDRLTSPEYGIDIHRIKAITQGYRMSGAIKTTERALAGNTLVHCGQLMMAWCAGNAKVTQSGNATMVTKQHSGTAKIDPLMSLFNCASLMGLNPEGQGSLDEWLSSLGNK